MCDRKKTMERPKKDIERRGFRGRSVRRWVCYSKYSTIADHDTTPLRMGCPRAVKLRSPARYPPEKKGKGRQGNMNRGLFRSDFPTRAPAKGRPVPCTKYVDVTCNLGRSEQKTGSHGNSRLVTCSLRQYRLRSSTRFPQKEPS